MTFSEWSEKYLTDNGLWPAEAKAVDQGTKDSKAAEAMATRWNDDISGYPPTIIAVLQTNLDRQAVEYIDANCPQHFARPMFA